MSTHSITFNLPEEEYEFTCAIKGMDYLRVLKEVDEYLRQQIKYREHTEEETRVYEEIRKLLHDELNERAAPIYEV